MEDNNTPSWKTIKTEEVYDTPWISVHHHDVITPAGTKGIYGTVSFKNRAVGIVALDPQLNTYIVRQYRYPLKKYSWEIPEGGCPKELSLLEGAKKELREEAGLLATNWRLIQTLDLSNSATDEYAEIFLATGLSQVEQELEETEDIILRKLPFESFYEMILNGEITDAISVAAGLKIKIMLDRGEI